MNLVIITGNLVKIYQNSETQVKIVVADTYKDNTTYIPVMCFKHNATWAMRNLQVADHISITGCVGTYKSSTGGEHLSIIAHQISYEGYPSTSRKQQKAKNYESAVSSDWTKPVAMPDQLKIEEL